MAYSPTFLIIEVEPAEGISTRKLVVETAKMNVLTAYSGREGLELFARFPAVDAVVLHARLDDMRCEETIRHIKTRQPDKPVVVLAPGDNFQCPSADHVVSAYDPHRLLQLLQSIAAANGRAA